MFRICYVRHIKQCYPQSFLPAIGIRVATYPNDGLIIVWMQISWKSLYFKLSQYFRFFMIGKWYDKKWINLSESNQIQFSIDKSSWEYSLAWGYITKLSMMSKIITKSKYIILSSTFRIWCCCYSQIWPILVHRELIINGALYFSICKWDNIFPPYKYFTYVCILLSICP